MLAGVIQKRPDSLNRGLDQPLYMFLRMRHTASCRNQLQRNVKRKGGEHATFCKWIERAWSTARSSPNTVSSTINQPCPPSFFPIMAHTISAKEESGNVTWPILSGYSNNFRGACQRGTLLPRIELIGGQGPSQGPGTRSVVILYLVLCQRELLCVRKKPLLSQHVSLIVPAHSQKGLGFVSCVPGAAFCEVRI